MEIKIPSQFCDRNDNPSQIGDRISILSQNNKDLFNKIFVTKKCRKFRPNLIILGRKIIPSRNSVSVWCFSCSVNILLLNHKIEMTCLVTRQRGVI